MTTTATSPSFVDWWQSINQHEAQSRDIEDFARLSDLIHLRIQYLLRRDDSQQHGRGHLIVTNSWWFNSLPLPVIGYKDARFSLRFTRPPSGVGWVISIRSKYSVVGNFHQLFPENLPVDATFMRNLPPDWWFGSLTSNRTEFTVRLLSDEELFAFILILVDLVEED